MNEKEQAMQKNQGAGNSMMKNRLAECPTTGTNCCVLFNRTKRGQHAGL